MYKSGTISIVGNTNSGKSTLLNSIIGKLITVPSPRKQTTRRNIVGIYHGENSELVFIDTPGLATSDNLLHKNMRQDSINSTEVDLVLLLIDITSKTPIDKYLVKQIKKINVPTFLVINKIDLVKTTFVIEKIVELKDLLPFKEVIPVSAFRRKNIDKLINLIEKEMPEGEQFYDLDENTEEDLESQIEQRILQTLMYSYNNEIPHELDINIISLKETDQSIRVEGEIIVAKESHKKIVIGKNGDKINSVIMKIKKRLKSDFQKSINITLSVRYAKNWFNNETYLKNKNAN